MKENEDINNKNMVCSKQKGKVSRRLVIVIENDSIEDGFWKPLIKETLMEYINNPLYGNHGMDILISPNGNRLTAIANSWFGELTQHEALRLQE